MLFKSFDDVDRPWCDNRINLRETIARKDPA